MWNDSLSARIARRSAVLASMTASPAVPTFSGAEHPPVLPLHLSRKAFASAGGRFVETWYQPGLAKRWMWGCGR